LAVSRVRADAVRVTSALPMTGSQASRTSISRWYGDAEPVVVRAQAAVGAALLLIGLLARRRQLVSERCTQCATPISPFVLREAYSAHRCVSCFQIVVSANALTADQIDARRERIANWKEAAPKLRLAG